MDRPLPQNIEAEVGILGSIIMAKELAGEILQDLDKSYFSRQAHQIIFETLGKLYDKNIPLDDLVLLKEELKKNDLLEKAGGAEYLASILQAVPSIANVEYYAQIVRNKGLMRNLISAVEEIKNEALEDSADVEQILDNAERAIFQISQRKTRSEAVPINDILPSAFDVIENPSRLMGISTGFHEFDKLTSGLQNSSLIIIAGRPSMGKTSFALNLAEHVALNENMGVVVYSLEMSKEQVVQNMICSRAKVSLHELRTGQINKDQYSLLSCVAGDFYQAKIYIDDTPGLSIRDIRNKSRRLKTHEKINLIIIDYLQLMESGGGKFENRQQEISNISRALKALARELEVPIVALSQLNRSVDARDDHRPRMSDLRESGALEQDADLVIFLYRDEYYNPNTEHQGTAEVIIAKQRNGPTDTVKLAFLRNFMRFENLVSHFEGASPLR